MRFAIKTGSQCMVSTDHLTLNTRRKRPKKIQRREKKRLSRKKYPISLEQIISQSSDFTDGQPHKYYDECTACLLSPTVVVGACFPHDPIAIIYTGYV